MKEIDNDKKKVERIVFLQEQQFEHADLPKLVAMGAVVLGEEGLIFETNEDENMSVVLLDKEGKEVVE